MGPGGSLPVMGQCDRGGDCGKSLSLLLVLVSMLRLSHFCGVQGPLSEFLDFSQMQLIHLLLLNWCVSGKKSLGFPINHLGDITPSEHFY